MVLAPRVLVVAADDDLLGPLAQGLDALGWRTLTARTTASGMNALADLPIDAVVIDARDPDAASRAGALKMAALPRHLPILAVGDTLNWREGLADLSMISPPHPAQAALRLEQLSRAAVAEEEMAVRKATFAANNSPLDAETAPQAPPMVLAAGKADTRFLALSNALAALGCEVVAAPTPYTAFDYLHERAFDAVVLWGGEDHAPALSIASGMKRNTRLYHIPMVLYLRGANEIDLNELYNRGFSDVASASSPEDETAQRIDSLARAHQRHLATRKSLEAVRGSGLTDPATGLFTPELFASHLARLAEGARLRRRPLSVGILRIAESDAVRHARATGWLNRALPQIGSMVSRLIRTEDTAARLKSDVFAMALPATRAGEARIALERIAAVIGCTAFDAGPDHPPFVADFEVAVAEMQTDESAASVLERANAALDQPVTA